MQFSGPIMNEVAARGVIIKCLGDDFAHAPSSSFVVRTVTRYTEFDLS